MSREPHSWRTCPYCLAVLIMFGITVLALLGLLAVFGCPVRAETWEPRDREIALLRGSQGADSVLVAARGHLRDESGSQEGWRSLLLGTVLCRCPAPFSWTVYESKASSRGRLVLLDARGVAHNPGDPCRDGLPIFRSGLGAHAFYSLPPERVAGGLWITARGDTVSLAREGR